MIFSRGSFAASTMSTFAQLIKLPIPHLKSPLEQHGVKSKEPRTFCKYLGLPQTGSNNCDNSQNLEKLSEEDVVPKSLERRVGRERGRLRRRSARKRRKM